MKLIITLSFVLLNLTLSAQSIPDTIIIKHRDYIYQGKELSAVKLRKLIESNPSTINDLQNARINMAMAGVLSLTGTTLVVLSARNLLLTKKFNPTLTFTGLGFFVFSIPFSNNVDKFTRRAIRTYNRGILYPEISSIEYPHTNIKFGCTSNGIGLIIGF